MALNIPCPGCKAVLHVRDEYAGKEMQCPRCGATVPIPEQAAVEAVTEAGAPAVASPPAESSKVCPECGQQIASTARKCRFCKAWLEEDGAEDEDLPERQPSPYRVCPHCGASGAKRVLFTFWGSFYGPALFTHVRCPECGYGYNGQTGRSNIVPAVLFVTIPAVLIVAIIVAVVILLVNRLS